MTPAGRTTDRNGIPRDRYGRPVVFTPSGKGKQGMVAYTRATTLAETLDDRYNLEKWKLRQVAVGLAARPDLLALVGASRDDKQALDRITDDAMAASAAGAAANLGTALHAFTEQMDRGEELFGVLAAIQPDLDAYREIMQAYKVLDIETFVVCDEIQVAGTFDRIIKPRTGGKAIVADLKTGQGAVTYGQTAIAVQLAVYAHGRKYDPVSGKRTALNVDQERAVVIHIPVGSGKASLYDVDIAAGWEAAQHAVWVRTWRKRNDLFTSTGTAETIIGADPVFARIAAAITVAELEATYREAVGSGIDPEYLIPACRERKAQITAALVA